MDLRSFTDEMRRRGCVSEKNTFCGDANGYPFTVVYARGKPGGATAFSLQFVFAQKTTEKLNKALKAEIKPLAKLGTIITGTPLLSMMLTIKDEDTFGTTFDSIMNGVTATVRQFGYTVPPVCPVCRQLGCDSYAQVAGGYVPAHAACIQQKSWQEHAKAEDNTLNGNYATGIIGAVLGGVIGAIPTVLVLYFTGFILAILCALVPLCAYYGYKLLRGKMTGAVLWIVIVVSALMAPVVNYLTELAFFLADGYYITPLDYITLFGEFAGVLLPSILQNLLFIGLGVFVVFGIIRRSNSHTVKQAAFSAASLRPIAGAAPPQPAQVAAPAPIMPPAPQPATPPPVAPQPVNPPAPTPNTWEE